MVINCRRGCITERGLSMCRFIDQSPSRALSTSAAKFTFNDPTYDFGVQQLLKGNVYIVIGTSDHPQGELQGHAVLGYAAQPAKR